MRVNYRHSPNKIRHTIKDVDDKAVAWLSTFNSNRSCEVMHRSQVDVLDVIAVYADSQSQDSKERTK